MQICKHESSCLISALRGSRNGVFYGAKIRFLHALVMTFLFKQGTLKSKLAAICKLTYEHAKNLGSFVFLYKYLVCLQNRVRGQTSKTHSLTAGAIIGYFVFRKKTQVNQQITFYLLSRIIVGLSQNLQNGGKIPKIELHPYFTAVCWGIVMFLFEADPGFQIIQTVFNFLQNKDSDKKVESWIDFVPLNIPYFLSFIQKIKK